MWDIDEADITLEKLADEETPCDNCVDGKGWTFNRDSGETETCSVCGGTGEYVFDVRKAIRFLANEILELK